jgi:hypothetical protein
MLKQWLTWNEFLFCWRAQVLIGAATTGESQGVWNFRKVYS